MTRLRSFMKIFVPAILAGLAIGIGGCVFLSLENKIVGSVCFSVGLYAICVHGLNLYTGKIGYLAEKSGKEFPPYLGTVCIIWLGNLVGTVASGLTFSATRIQGIAQTANAICQVKLNDNMLSLFLLGIFCGMLMYIAVEGYKRCSNPLILFFCVCVFILCGFEHCIADMFYFAMAGIFTGKALLILLIVTLGNSVGGMLLPFCAKVLK